MAIKNNITRLDKNYGLVISLFLFLSACAFKDDKSNHKPGISLFWEGSKAVGIAIPRNLVTTGEGSTITVRLAETDEQPAILGKIETNEEAILFRPLIPFTPGLHYNIFTDTIFVGGVTIPHPENTEAPVLLSVYPTSDTVPENLLKMYFQFSKPMQAGNALQHITLIDGKKDTVPAPFLALQPELWNKEGTLLTLWLDPGRIKKDLQPNKALGPPLIAGEKIALKVAPSWKDQEGALLGQAYIKQFYVSSGDKSLPVTDTWKLKIPKPGTRQPLTISFGEPLDYALLHETITIYGKEGESIPGNILLEKEESILHFTPNHPWKKGNHRIHVESRLEDLAGNNLNRPFEIDYTKYQQHNKQAFYTLEYQVQ